ncbi:MAG TPA: TonB-dependent receptor [Chitinophagaceae bacterium]|nr:TonB-dependent receptor [Chitinophagaceae bacterium]
MSCRNLLKKIVLPALLVIISQISWAQEKTVTGKITDSKDGSPVARASVVAKGSNRGTTTADDGTFRLTVGADVTTLVITSVGYDRQEVAIGADNTVAVAMAPTGQDLNVVVVTGYGTSRKKDLTGAVSNISAKDFNQGIVTNPIQQVQGKVAGLVVTVPGGDPNQAPIIRLRGQTSLTGGQTPLIVVDQVPLDDPNELNNIPASDIASYDVLKDASATAIYGSRGANGVIIITTKKGQAGRTQVEYNGYVGLDKQAKYYDMLSAKDWRAAVANPGSLDKGANTDWQKAISRTAFTHSHTASLSGGARGFTYRASLNYLNQEGIILNTGKEQYGLRFNAQQKALNDKLELTMGIINTLTKRKLLNYGNISKVFNTPPTYPVYNSDGSYFAFSDFEQFNAVEHLNEEVNNANENLSLIYGTANYELIKGLKVGVTGSSSRFTGQTQFFQPTFPLEANFNNASVNTYNTDSRKGDMHANYVRTFGKHSLNATAVYEYNYFVNSSMGATGQNFLVPQNQFNNFSSAIDPTRVSASTYKEEYKLISFLGRINYIYNSKYYVTASIRRDGSSKFGVNNRWGNFPSFDVAWRISQENFMRNIPWLSDLKLRAGYGVTGNSDAITPYATLLLYGPGGRYYDAVNQIYPQSYSPSQNANPDLRWEERHGKNIGVDFALFNNRLTGDVNVFNDETRNLLYTYTVPVPPFFINTILANVGNLTNKGVEIALSGQILKGHAVTWTANGQITFIKTRVTSLSGTYQGYKLSTDQIPGGYATGRGLSSNPITYLKPGYAPYEFYLAHFTGIDKDGHQLFDSAGVKSLTQDQNPNPTKYYIDPSPKFTYGINNTFTYGNWDLNFFVRGVAGQKIFNNTLLNFENINRLPGNNVTKKALTNGIKDAAFASDLWLQKASYLRLDNATIAYTFPNLKGNIKSVRVYLAANNLFVITPYGGIDPEIQTANTGSNQAYIDVTYYGSAFYPRTRSFALGVNVAFQ